MGDSVEAAIALQNNQRVCLLVNKLVSALQDIPAELQICLGTTLLTSYSTFDSLFDRQ